MSRRVVATLVAVAIVAPLGGGVIAQSEPASMFTQAEGLLRLGDLDGAATGYRQIVDQFPRSDFPDLVWRAAAQVRIGDLLWREGHWRRAGSEYVAVVESEPLTPWTARAENRLAHIALIEQDWIGAVDLLQRLLASGLADDDTSASARRSLTLAARFNLAAAEGRAPYTGSRVLAVGTEIDRPVAIAASSDGQVLVVDEGTPAVILKDPDRDRGSTLPYNAHTRPWWGFDGLPYLPTRRAGVIALGGSQLGFLSREGGRTVPLKELEAGVRAPDGSWYLLDADPRRILKFAADGTYRGTATADREEPADLAMDGIGRLHVLERTTSRVVRFDVEGEREDIVAAANWRRPEAIAVDRIGNIYVLDRDERTIDIFAPDGRRLQRLGPMLPGGVELRGPRDLAVDGAGRIYVADRSARQVVVLE